MNLNSTIQRAVILAAGRGKRLGAITQDLPKPMIPIQGKPVLELILIGLLQAGWTDFHFVVGYHSEAIEEHFGNGERWNVHISYAYQAEPNGTGAALAYARDFARDETILATYGDILTDYAHYHTLRTKYLAVPCSALIGINYLDDPSAGAAVYRERDRIVCVVEKPPPGTATGCWNIAGISLFGPAIWPVLEALQPSPRGEYELTEGVMSLISQGDEVRAHELHGFWSDIGTPEALIKAEQTWDRKRDEIIDRFEIGSDME